MELVLAALCDGAHVDGDGKLNIRGAFNDLYAQGFPARQDRMVLVLVMEWDRSDDGRYLFTADLVGPDGTPTLTVSGHSDVDRREEQQPPARTRVVMPLEKVIFPTPGAYRLRVSAKGHPVEGPALHLIPSEHPPRPVPGPEGVGEGS